MFLKQSSTTEQIEAANEVIRSEWRSGRAAYQRVSILNAKRMLSVLREHPDCSADEFVEFSGFGIGNINEKFIKKYKAADGVWRYRALTLDEFNQREEEKQRTKGKL